MPFLITPLGSFVSCTWGFIWKGAKKTETKHLSSAPSPPQKNMYFYSRSYLYRKTSPLSTAQPTKPCMSQEQVALCPRDGVGCSSPHPQTPLINRTHCKGFTGSVESLLSSVLLKAMCAHVEHSVKLLN